MKRLITTLERLGICAVTISAAMVASGCRGTDWRTMALSPQPLQSPAAGNSLSPNLTSSKQGVLFSWLERSGDTTLLKFAERSASGWTSPVTVSGTAGKLVTNYADIPSVIRMSDGTLAANWDVVTNPMREGTDLFLSVSKDNGRTWAPPVTPHHDGTPTQHAFATLFELPTKGLGVIWLDARAYDLESSDDLGIRYAAFETDWKQTADQFIDSRVCECCPTSAAVTADGVVTAYRNRSDAEVRDIYTSRLENGKWTEGQVVHADGWEIEGCPVNGPAVSAIGRDAVVAWFTTKNGVGQSYAAFSSDAARTWGQPIRLDDAGSSGRVGVVLLNDGTAVVSWIEVFDKHSQLRIRRLDKTGAKSPAVNVSDMPGGMASNYPRMARAGDEIVLAWNEPESAKDNAAQHVKLAAVSIKSAP